MSTTMEMQEYCNNIDWSHVLAELPPLCSSPLLTREEEEEKTIFSASASTQHCMNELSLITTSVEDYRRMFSAPTADDHLFHYQNHQFHHTAAVMSDTATIGLDDTLLLPFSEIDLEAFSSLEFNAPIDEKVPLDMILPADHNQDVVFHDEINQNSEVHDHNYVITDYSGYEMVGYGEKEEISVAVEVEPLAAIPPGRKGSNGWSATAGRTRLDHIGFEELKKFFYMPITKAAREMNVGLTVLKKRCRELGIARWPHRKMKSLKSLILNVQEMGKGMSPETMREELTALETYCSLMEVNPAIELTERTKKLRQACFKESYKRRRAAAASSILQPDQLMTSFFAHHLPLPSCTSSSTTTRRHQSSSSSSLGYY